MKAFALLVKSQMLSKPWLRPLYFLLQSIKRLLGKTRRHFQAVVFIFWRVLPLLIRTRCRPVIFSRYMALGDVICTFPAINELKKKHPASAFIYFCREDYACLPRMAGVTDHIVSHIDIKLIETCYAFFFSAIYQFTYGDERENSASVESVIEEYCRQHGVAITAVHPRLQVRPDVLTKVNQILKNVGLTKPGPTVAIHPGPSGPFREWSNESWLAFVQALKHSGFTNIIQLGATRSDDVGKALDGKIPDVISLINQLSLEESIALISLCDLLVGIDSGLLHIAASVGTPFVGIFGATSPQLRFSSAAAQFSVVSRVVCQGCHHRIPRLHWVTGCPFDFNCMKSIQVNDVLLACRAKISLAVSGRPEK